MAWGKTQPILPSHEYTCNLCFLGGAEKKTGPAHSFPTLTRLNINLVQKVIGCGKTVVHMVNRLWKKHSQPYPVMNTHVTFAVLGVGKNWTGPFFPHPDKVKHQPCAEGYRVGGKLLYIWLIVCRTTQPTLSCHEYICNLCFLGGGEKLGRPILFRPWQG